MANHIDSMQLYYKEYLNNNKILLKNARKKVFKMVEYHDIKECETNIYNDLIDRKISYYEINHRSTSTTKIYREMPWNLVSVYVYRLKLSGHDVLKSVQDELNKGTIYTYWNGKDYEEFSSCYEGFVQTYDPFEVTYTSKKKKKRKGPSLEELLKKIPKKDIK